MCELVDCGRSRCRRHGVAAGRYFVLRKSTEPFLILSFTSSGPNPMPFDSTRITKCTQQRPECVCAVIEPTATTNDRTMHTSIRFIFSFENLFLMNICSWAQIAHAAVFNGVDWIWRPSNSNHNNNKWNEMKRKKNLEISDRTNSRTAVHYEIIYYFFH